MKVLTKNILVFAAVSAMYLGGVLNFAERHLIDLRYRLLQRDATGEIVVVKIDPVSLAEQGVWPWPRSRHAELLDRLFKAGAREVAFDIDFSSRQNPVEDARLAAALNVYGDRVILPVFKQEDRHSSGITTTYTKPIADFLKSVRTASLNVRPDADGTIRMMQVADSWPDDFVPTLATMLSGTSRGATDNYNIDFGIRAQSVPQLSYADILRGNFDRSRIAGKIVIVGATASELGDSKPVPVRQDMPGPLIQAIAAESLLQGRDLASSPWAVVLLGIAVIALLVTRRKRTKRTAVPTAG